MKILYVTCKYHPMIGGSAVHVKNVAERLARKHDVMVFVSNPNKDLPAEELINEVKVRRFRCFAPSDSYYFSPSLSSAVRRTRADIVHIHGYYDLTSPMTILSKNKTARCVFTLHSTGSSSEIRKTLRLPYNIVMRRIMQRVDRIICVSNFELKFYARLLNLPRDRLTVIPNGVPNSFRKKDCVKAHPPILLSAGRLEKCKGFHRVLRAFKVFKELFPQLGMRLYILGKGPYESSLVRESERLGIRGHVSFLGWRLGEEYASLLRASSVFILLSDYESQSIAVSEALYAGTPAIVSNNSALSEYVQGGYALGVNDPDDAYEVAMKIKSLYSNPQICKISDYKIATWEEVVEKTSKEYEDVFATRSKSTV